MLHLQLKKSSKLFPCPTHVNITAPLITLGLPDHGQIYDGRKLEVETLKIGP